MAEKAVPLFSSTAKHNTRRKDTHTPTYHDSFLFHRVSGALRWKPPLKAFRGNRFLSGSRDTHGVMFSRGRTHCLLWLYVLYSEDCRGEKLKLIPGTKQAATQEWRWALGPRLTRMIHRKRCRAGSVLPGTTGILYFLSHLQLVAEIDNLPGRPSNLNTKAVHRGTAHQIISLARHYSKSGTARSLPCGALQPVASARVVCVFYVLYQVYLVFVTLCQEHVLTRGHCSSCSWPQMLKHQAGSHKETRIS